MNGTTPTRVRSIRITHFAGVTPDTAFELADLSPGVNILHGPNGSGKSTAARAMQRLLWPDPAEHDNALLEAEIESDGASWRLTTLPGGGIQATRNGLAHAPPEPAPPGQRQRHAWTLRDLLESDDRDLAQRIATALTGGVDFDALANALGWDKSPTSPRKLHQELQQVRKDIREIVNKQIELQREAAAINDLRTRRDFLRARAAAAPLIRTALESLEVSARLHEVRQRLAAASAPMTAVREEDASHLRRILDTLAETEQALAAVRQQIEDLGPGETGWALFPDSDLNQALGGLEPQLREISRKRDLRENAQRQLEEIEAREASLRTRLGLLRPSAFEQAGAPPEFRQFVETQLRALAARAEAAALAARVPSTHMDPAPLEIDPDLIRNGRITLESWLLHAAPAPPTSHLALVLSLLIVSGLTIALALRHDPRWLLVLAAIPALLYSHHRLTQDRRIHIRASLRERFPSDLPQPDEWTLPAVRATLRELDRLLEQVHRHQLAETDRALALDARLRADAAEQALDQALSALRHAGLSLDSRDPQLAHLLQDLREARELRCAAAAAESALQQAREAEAEALRALHRILSPWMSTPVPPDLPTAERLCADLRRRLDLELSRRRQRHQADTRLQHLAERERDSRRELEALLARHQLTEPDLPEVRRRVELLPAWRADLRASEQLEHRLSELRNILAEHPELCDVDDVTLQTRLRECEAAAAEAAKLHDDITRLDDRIDRARLERQLHEKSEREAVLLAELHDARAHALAIETGRELLAWLRDTCRVREQPALLREANRLLALFTAGTLALSVARDPRGEQFVAMRPGHAPRPLSTLSTGERAQLLIAVRLAFVCEQERSVMPLFVDEALGTSDETRSAAILDALAALAREGRQIFYLTAQRDEAAKCREALLASNTPHRVIDLAALRAGQSAVALPPPTRSPLDDPAPRPNESETDWLRRLGVQPLNPWKPVEDCHLWHLLPTPEHLLPLLRHGITTWGQLQALVAADAARGLISDEALEQARDRAAALDAFAKAWRIGRARPITPAELLATGAVSETFAQEAVALLNRLAGDPQRLLEALETGAIPRWRKTATDKLRDSLHEQGLLPTEPPLDEPHLIARAYAILQAAHRFRPHTDYRWAIPCRSE